MLKNKNFIITICLLALTQVCKAQDRIKTNTIKEVPYLVQVWRSGVFVCDGVLISKRHVVATADYVYGAEVNDLSVAVGVTDISEKSKKLNVANISLPESYADNPFDMNLAVLTLQSPVENPKASPIKLCNKPLTSNSNVKVSGWSRITGESESLLHTVNVKTITKSKCKSDYYFDGDLTKSMFCATAPSIKYDCIDYTTGAAVANGKLCGIVSQTVGCENLSYPGIYIDISKMKSFIKGVMKKN